MPPMLDDMCKSGKIRKGFKIANPGLRPETLINYELGSTALLIDKIRIEPSVYLSQGKDFQYLIGTGDSIDTGGDDLKPVFQRRNVSEIRILGAELTFTYSILPNLIYAANYAYNHSTITEYDADSESNMDLSGARLDFSDLEESARELLQAFWIKFHNHPAPPKMGVTAKESGTYTDFALINVGGLTKEGKDGVNDMTYLILDVIEEMRMVQPSSMAQLSKKNPDRFIKRAARIIRQRRPCGSTPLLVGAVIRRG